MNLIKSGLLIRNLFFINTLILFSSCIYEPFGLYENPVKNNPLVPEISSVELNANADTLWIYGDQKLKYHFKSSNKNQPVLGLKFYIDGIICDSVMSESGDFNILQSALSAGVHKMNIILFAKSGTGSIADRLNAEAILLTKEWVVIADYSKRNVTYTIENGYLKLHWDKYKNLDLKYFRIQYSGTTQNNYYVDSLYYGAKRTYTITVEKTNGDIITWGLMDISENIPKPELKISENKTYYFCWPKSPYYNAVKYRYEFHNSDDNSSAYGDYGFKKANDTVFIGSLHFSDHFNFSLYTLPKTLPEYTSDYMMYPRGYILQYAGEPITLKDYTSFTSPDTISSFDNKNVYKYFVTGQIVYNQPIIPDRSIGLGALQFSPRGKYLFGGTYNTGGLSLKYFIKDLSTGNVFYLDNIDPNSSSIMSKSSYISDNGIGIFQTANKDFFFDFRNNIEIASRNVTTQGTNTGLIYLQNRNIVKMAPDGKHYMTSTVTSDPIVVLLDVFKNNASKLEKMYSIESGTTNYQFSPTDPNIITALKDKTLSVIQCEPYALLRKIEFASDEVFMNIDYFNNEILSINASQFIIRSLNTGNEIKRIAKRTEQYYLYENFLLHNHHIIKNNVMLKTN
jgi:hypothetical protein